MNVSSITISQVLTWNVVMMIVFVGSNLFFCLESTNFVEGIFRKKPTQKRKNLVLIALPVSATGISSSILFLPSVSLHLFLLTTACCCLLVVSLTQFLLSRSIVVFSYQVSYCLTHIGTIFLVHSELINGLFPGGKFPVMEVFGFAGLIIVLLAATVHRIYEHKKKNYGDDEKHRTVFYMVLMALIIGFEPVLALIYYRP